MNIDLPFTEQSHPVTKTIDAASPEDISKLMLAAEEDIFNGWKESEGIFKDGVLEKIRALRCIVTDMLKDANANAIILAGCGTSGRLAFFVSRTMNAHLRSMNINPCFDYLIAGEDQALFASKEAPEDDPFIGRHMLQEASNGKRHVLYIGITCGLSASYIAGQLDLCMEDPVKYTPVLIGFNSVEKSRSTQTKGWGKSFQQVAKELVNFQDNGQAFIINPIIGPEAITGSSRLKGGTATKIILEAIFNDVMMRRECSSISLTTEEIFKSYQIALKAAHDQQNDFIIGQAIQIAADGSRNGGHVYYVGDETLGIVGMIDASECPPTFGTSPSKIRGFSRGGFSTLGNKCGGNTYEMEISLDFFKRNILPYMKENDVLVVLSKDKDMVLVPDLSRNYKAIIVNIRKSQYMVLTEEETRHFDVSLDIDISPCVETQATPIGNLMYQPLAEMAVKWFCNTLTTGAHIAIGKVFNNYMIDVQVRNDKLFHRAVRITQSCVSCDSKIACRLLIRAIHRCDDPPETIMKLPISEHVEVATQTSEVVPLAIICGLTGASIEEGLALCFTTSLLRESIINCLANKALKSKDS